MNAYTAYFIISLALFYTVKYNLNENNTFKAYLTTEHGCQCLQTKYTFIIYACVQKLIRGKKAMGILKLHLSDFKNKLTSLPITYELMNYAYCRL